MMRECPHCGRRASALDRLCSTCSTPLGAGDRDQDAPDDFSDPSESPFEFDEAGLTPIARFLNAAEAGYFAHELKLAERLPVVITAEESFDAVAGFWTTRFLLCVRDSAAARAAEALQKLVDESESDGLASQPTAAQCFGEPACAGSPAIGAFDPARPAPAEVAEPGGVGWVPLVLTLAAGSAAFWSVRRHDGPPRPPAAPVKRHDADPWERFPTRPWTAPHEPGQRL